MLCTSCMHCPKKNINKWNITLEETQMELVANDMKHLVTDGAIEVIAQVVNFGVVDLYLGYLRWSFDKHVVAKHIGSVHTGTGMFQGVDDCWIIHSSGRSGH